MLELRWDTLVRPAQANVLSGIRVPAMPDSVPAYLALERDGRRHFLVEIGPDTEDLREDSTRGLRVTTQDWIIGDYSGRYVDLACSDPSLYDTFDAVILQVAEKVASSPADPRDAVVNALSRWRKFWAVDAEGLSRRAEVGLIGEMWFMQRWMAPLTAAKFASWYGPDAARHDFQTRSLSIEVKTTASTTGAFVHHIESLDQLADPEAGQLYLFSMRISYDPIGSNTLHSLVENARVAAQELGEDVISQFDDRLSRLGYSPARLGRYRDTFRVLGETLYRVDEAFPRLTRGSFSADLFAAIPDVSYLLLPDALGAWRVGSRPSDVSGLFDSW